MPFNILATSGIGRIVSRRVRPQLALRQARAYRRRGYTDVTIVDIDTEEVLEIADMAAWIEAKVAGGA